MVASTLAGLTVAGHTAAGGAPDPVGVVLVVLLSAGLAQLLAARRLRALPVLALLLAGQGLAHVVLSLAGHHAPSSSGPGTGAMLTAHVIAAAVAALVLVHADRLVDRWLRLTATILGAPALALPDLPRPAAARPRETRAPSPSDLLLHHAGRRGPPVRLLLA